MEKPAEAGFFYIFYPFSRQFLSTRFVSNKRISLIFQRFSLKKFAYIKKKQYHRSGKYHKIWKRFD